MAKKLDAQICPIIPAPGKLVVKPDKPEEKVGNIVIPESVKANQRQTTGRLLAIGEYIGESMDAWINMGLKHGCTIIYGIYAGNTLKTKEGEEYLILSQDDILGVEVKE